MNRLQYWTWYCVACRELRLCVLNAAPFEKRRWRFINHHRTGFTDKMFMTIACNISCSTSTHIPLQCSTVWISANRISGCIWGWWGVCAVTGTSSVQSDCLWKELVLYAGNGVSSPWFRCLESLMVLCAFLTHHLEGQNHLGCCKSINDI